MAIHQEVTINATPSDVFDVLMSSEKFSSMTGGRKAEISQDVGGKVSLFDGEIEALNVELVPGKRIVQTWRAAGWPDGVFSIIRFELTAKGRATDLVFDQSGYPDGAETELEAGWYMMYWEPMMAILNAN